jgi:hypothetical protein
MNNAGRDHAIPFKPVARYLDGDVALSAKYYTKFTEKFSGHGDGPKSTAIAS